MWQQHPTTSSLAGLTFTFVMTHLQIKVIYILMKKIYCYGNSNILKCRLLQILVGTLTLNDLEVKLTNLGAVNYDILLHHYISGHICMGENFSGIFLISGF